MLALLSLPNPNSTESSALHSETCRNGAHAMAPPWASSCVDLRRFCSLHAETRIHYSKLAPGLKVMSMVAHEVRLADASTNWTGYATSPS